MVAQVWFYITWAVFVWPVVSAAASLAFLASSAALWYTFLHSWRSDPGVITASKADKFRVSVSLLSSSYWLPFHSCQFVGTGFAVQ